MLFKGRLRLPSDPGEGIPIDLELEDVILSLVSEGEDFGEWRLDKVEIKRLFSNQFALLLDGEEMVFVADDALGFAYDGLTFVEDVTGRLSKRRLFKGRKPSKRQTAEPDVAADDQPPSDDRVDDDRIPEAVPFFPEPAEQVAAIADTPAAEMPGGPVEPLGRQMSDLVGDDAQDFEVPAPSNSVEVAPAKPAGDVAPIITSAIEQSSVEASTADEISADLAEPEAPTAATTEIPPAPIPVIEPANASGTEAVEVDDDDDDEEELVIEDVAAYGYVPPVSTRSPLPDAAPEIDPDEQPAGRRKKAPAAPDEPFEPSIEPIESVQTPAARAPEVHPLGEPDPVVEVPKSTHEVAEETTVAEPLTPPSTPPAEPTMPIESTNPITPTPPTGPAEPAPATEFAWSSNGHSADDEVSVVASDNGSEAADDGDSLQTQKSGRHARSGTRSRSSSLFGRKKSREPEEHEHRYESSKTVGGITRSVCAVCGHVSFAGEDVYQGW